MQETIDLIGHRELRNLQRYTRETGQPTKLSPRPRTDDELSVHRDRRRARHDPLQQATKRNYNTNEITHKEWVYKYNDDPEYVEALRRVIELSRKHLYDLPTTWRARLVAPNAAAATSRS